MQYIIPLHIIDLQGDGFHPLIDITLFGKTYKLVLDTGASRTALDKTLLTEANGEDFILASDKLSTGLGTNNMVSFTATLSDMYIGQLQLDNFDAAVLDLSTINIAYEQLNHPKVLGVLGGDILMEYKAVIDYGKRQVIFKTRMRKA
ncbi:retroviral-like aspartic protease family protein [Mucilaginibacter roseus]|uniref:Retroviral-like aspartic protease family protein n=1 Tax=Mucilaginibacter roseus TaxID=1528868 RepID=A0ABS8U3L2_9SPHI|nr:retropepsin-like aspartic protease [Mucilaginibacter roseus]MCD8741709.1 retroviral-like aspartic protease family protein [Mucilaginibacter roseus]